MQPNQPHNYINHHTQPTINNKSMINTISFIAPFYSIKLIEFKKLFNTDLRSLHHARAQSIIVIHLSKYNRCLQTNMADTYGLSGRLILKVITMLLDAGYIRAYPTKRKTNIGVYVPLTAYGITPTGKEMVKGLNDLLEMTISKLTK